MAAENGCAEKSCWELLRMAVLKSCWELLRMAVLRRAAENDCAEKSRWEWLWIKTSVKISSSFYAGWVWLTSAGDNPLVTSCSSDVQNCGEMQIFLIADQPSRHFVPVGRPKLWWNANFAHVPRNPLVTSCSSDVQNCGEMRICLGPLATLSSFRANWTSKTVVKCKFWSGRRNPLVTSCWTDVQNCGDATQISSSRNCSAHWPGVVTDCVLEALFGENLKKPRTKRSFWKLFLWKLSEASRETLVLKHGSVKIVGSIAQTLVLEACCLKSWGSLARNARFGSLFLKVDEVSHEMLVLEAFVVLCSTE